MHLSLRTIDQTRKLSLLEKYENETLLLPKNTLISNDKTVTFSLNNFMSDKETEEIIKKANQIGFNNLESLYSKEVLDWNDEKK